MNQKGSLENNKERNQTEEFVEAFMTFCYKFLGRRIDLKYDLKSVNLKLKQGDVNITPGLYISTILVTSLIMTVFGFVIFFLIFAFIIESPLWPLLVLVLTLTLFLASVMTYPFIVSSRTSKKKAEIEKELPYTLSELSILASTGLSPIQIIRKISKMSRNRYVANEFKKIVYKIDIEGKDIITALSETAKETPSPHFRENLWDFSNMIHEGGDIDRYLRAKADEGMNLKRAVQKEYIDRIGTMMELYISTVLMGVLFVSVGAFMMDSMGSSYGGMDGENILTLLAYGFIPLSIIVFTLVVSMSNASTE